MIYVIALQLPVLSKPCYNWQRYNDIGKSVTSHVLFSLRLIAFNHIVDGGMRGFL